jgi:trehalose utilization protein
MRTYQPIWEQLKSNKNNQVRIAAPGKLHKRIKKAVIKEKDIDITYKLILETSHKKAILYTERVSQNELLFTLKFFDDLTNIELKELF